MIVTRKSDFIPMCILLKLEACKLFVIKKLLVELILRSRRDISYCSFIMIGTSIYYVTVICQPPGGDYGYTCLYYCSFVMSIFAGNATQFTHTARSEGYNARVILFIDYHTKEDYS